MSKENEQPKTPQKVCSTDLLGRHSEHCAGCERKCTPMCQFHPDHWHIAAKRTAEFLLTRFEPRPCDCQAVSHCERCSVVALARWMLDDVIKPNA